MKGIILAGGSGTRLYPLTIATSKQLMPIYDKPMIYYPLSILMLLGIQDILIISTNEDIPRFQKLLGNGKNIGMKFSYEVQHEPKGLAEAFLIGEDFIGNDSVSLILGDNLFHGSGYLKGIRSAIKNIEGGLIFGYKVKNPKDYGVVEFDKSENKNSLVKSLEEKPLNPKSNYAIPGLYFYDNNVVKLTKELKPSDRGELEITDLNKSYLKEKRLSVQILGRGVTWFDTGTHRSLLSASNYVESLELRQGIKISCIEEIALHMGYINMKQLEEYISLYPNNEYRKYLKKLIK
tara:strand:- start:4872 stop:5747 length:876 start_codon:yes stop_codon:yes gene_type:complete